jgi:HD-like signal output (HDOD) protein
MKIAELINGIPSLGSYSGVIAEIETVLNCPDSNLADLGDVIEKDPDLTGRLLKLGNSAFFGFPNRLETVSEAISLIGIQQAKDLILVSNVVEIFDGISAEVVSMESFWKHCIACGVGARCLAIVRQMPKAEKFFVAGLLHDLGRLVLFSQAPKTAQRIFELYHGSRIRLWEAERQVLGFDHAAIGGELMASWQYPANLVHAVAYHHQPTSGGVYQLESALVHVADYLAHAMQMGNSGEHYVPPMNLKAWERLSLPPDMLESVMKSIDEQIESVQEVFLNSANRKVETCSV